MQRFFVISKFNLSLFLIAFSFLINAHSKEVVIGENFYSKIIQYKNYQMLHIKGAFLLGDQKYFDDVIDKLIPHKRILLSLDHYGGLNLAHRAFVKKINHFCRKKSTSCTIDTIVKDWNHCGSACIPLYMIGRYRMAGPRATFGFHATYVGPIDFPKHAMRIYDVAGINKDWIDQNSHLFATSEDYTQLLPHYLNGSNIVMLINDYDQKIHDALEDKWNSGSKIYDLMMANK